MPSAPKLLFLVTEDWYFYSHRLPMARAAQAAGFEVSVATRIGAFGEQIRAQGFKVHHFAWRRGDNTPWQSLRAIRGIRQLVRAERPDVIHAVSMKTVVYAGVALLAARDPALIASLTGMGYALESSRFGARILRLPINIVLRAMLRRGRSAFIVQNPSHQQTLLELAPKATERVWIIPGSGVDTRRFVPLPDPPARPVTVAFVGRLLADKGIRELIAAHDILRRRGIAVRLLIAGAPDPAQPTSIPEQEVRGWTDRPGVVWLGSVEDVRRVWAEAHMAVLPSYHEGLPLSLLEAAACARALVATDIPGCRGVAKPDVNALLVPVGNVPLLADAIERLVRDDALRQRFGSASRGVVEPELSAERIGALAAALYQRMIDRSQ
jgi:glycosyltransferase involved in cell wall biosynthesis